MYEWKRRCDTDKWKNNARNLLVLFRKCTFHSLTPVHLLKVISIYTIIYIYIYIKNGLLMTGYWLTLWKSDISDCIKWEFFQAVIMSVLVYSCTTWELCKDATCSFERILEAANSCTATYLPSRKPFTEHSVLLWMSSRKHTSVGCLAKTYVHQICVDTVYHLKDLPSVTTNRADGGSQRNSYRWCWWHWFSSHFWRV